MKEKLNIIQSAMQNRPIIFALTVTLMVFGIYALIAMPRQEYPTFTIRQGLIIAVFPGASSHQVEEQVTTKVENYLFGFQEVNKKKTYSISKEGVMIIFVELIDELNKVGTDAFWAKLRQGLNELKAQLPQEVLALISDNDFGDTSAILFTIESESKTYKELEDYLKQFENDLRNLEAVSKIKHFGLQKEQISIYINDEKLVFYGIKPFTVLGVLKTEGAVSYAGELNNGRIIMPLHVPPRYQSENDIAEQIIYSDPLGNIVRIKDVAKVVREYTEPYSYIQINGKKCLLVSIEMQEGNNIVQLGSDIDKMMKKFSMTIPKDIVVNKIVDLPQVVNASVGNFLLEFLIAILAVIAVTIILLPLKIAAVAALTIPVTILITLGILYAVGVELHMVTLSSLILVLGMVVDNAIVIVDDYVVKLDQGETEWDAAWKSVKELFVPVFTATLAIIAAYLPLMYFLTGVAGDFVRTLPLTVAIALGISLIAAAFLVPILNCMFIKKGLKRTENTKRKSSFLETVQDLFDRILDKAFKFPKITISFGIVSVILSIVLATSMSRQSFPKVERNQFAVEIYLPEGMSLEQTDEIAKKVRTILQKDPRVTNIASFIGTSSPRFHAAYAPNFPAKNYAQLIVNTISNKATEEILDEYSKKYRDYFPQAYIRWKQLEMSLTNTPIEVRISGDNINSIKHVAQQVSEIMKKDNRIIGIRDDYKEPLQGIRFDVNRDEANRLGFTKSIIAYSMAVGFKGLPVSTLWEGDYPVNVVLQRDKNKRNSYDDIENQFVSSPLFMSNVQVRNLAKLSPEWTEGQIVRRNGVRTLTVKADVERGAIATDVLNTIKPAIEDIKLPEGVKTEFGGEYESEFEVYVPQIHALMTSILLIFFILLFQFKRVKLVLLIACAMPISIVGGLLGLLLMNYPFGVTSFVGITSLCGMVVRNGIILVDYGEHLRSEKGFSIQEAAIAAGKRRMRPIFLTSTAAAFGVIPMILSRSTLWGPLGTVICFGLLSTLTLTLFVLPVLYELFCKSETLNSR